ncbi:MAG: Spi family protease inhibitor [Prevotella sp.]|nr:Spi family protease inhibitor [Prevotella sp.]
MANDFINNQLSEKSVTQNEHASQSLQPLRLSHETPTCYVFTSEAKGFVIVSKQEEDCRVVGYSTDGHFDISTMPQPLLKWLDEYATPARTPKLHNAIAPMLKTQWGQWKPYNLLVSNGNSADEVAKLMKYCMTSVGAKTCSPLKSFGIEEEPRNI